MTSLQTHLQLAQKMIKTGIPESLIAQALIRVLIDDYGIMEQEPTRLVCRNTATSPEHLVDAIKFNDEQPWHNINLEMES